MAEPDGGTAGIDGDGQRAVTSTSLLPRALRAGRPLRPGPAMAEPNAELRQRAA